MLPVETALRFGMTLIGFVRGDHFNVYGGGERAQSCTLPVLHAALTPSRESDTS
ncbi:MAG: formate dehydrogenase accessory sulfurtransferase FdhD [Acidobacteriota bacterium]